jgi:hypothetical protein
MIELFDGLCLETKSFITAQLLKKTLRLRALALKIPFSHQKTPRLAVKTSIRL